MLKGYLVIAGVVVCGCSRGPEANVRKGDELLRARDYAGARSRYFRAIKADRLFGPAYLGMGRAAVGLGDLPSADESLRRAVDLLPAKSKERQDAAIALADVYLRMDGTEARMQQVQATGAELCTGDPNSYDGRRLLGLAALRRAELHSRAGRKPHAEVFLKDAQSELAIANRVRPGQADVMAGLARSTAAGGRLGESEELFRSLIALEPGNPGWRAELYRVLLGRNQSREADAALAAAASAMPQFPEFAIMRAAQHLADRSHLQEALDRLAGVGAQWHPGFLAAGDFWVRAGEPGRARPVYERCAAESKPARQACLGRLLTLLTFEGKAVPARALARQILGEYRDDVSARLVEASARIEERNLVNALNELQSILVSDPRNHEVRYQLARVHMLSGEAEQARQQLSEAIELNPAFLEARLKLAQILIIRGEFKGALRIAAEILSRRPDSAEAHRIYDYAETRIANPGLRGLPGPAADNIRRLGQVRLVIEGDPSDAGPTTSADRALPPEPVPPASATDGIYLRDTIADDAIRGYRTLASMTYDKFDFIRPVPGTWPAPPRR